MVVEKSLSLTSLGWGRRKNANYLTGVKAVAMMLMCPCLTALFAMSMEFHGGSISTALDALDNYDLGQNSLFRPTFEMHKVIAGYLVVQAILYRFLPGPIYPGQLTPGGHLLQYKTNGLRAFFISCCLLGLADVTGFMKASYVARNWSPLIASLNVWGLGLTVALYVKARISPTHTADQVFSGNVFYDLFMGVELNPRLAILGDIKLFINGRTAMMAWPLIILSYAALQYETYGYISNSMLVTIGLHMTYIIDFFWFEHWYLQTIDVTHDHVGFYLAWGCMAWHPTTYTLQAQYLARSPVVLSNFTAASIFLVGFGGYLVFRSANNQKYRIRNSQGQCTIWGKPATFIMAEYKTSDGKPRKSLLLTSGWWGLARHVNYLGDLVLSYSMCAACGTAHLLPWFYAIYMSLLLLHRCYRDEARCEKKYGPHWHEYCDKVCWRIVPGIF